MLITMIDPKEIEVLKTMVTSAGEGLGYVTVSATTLEKLLAVYADYVDLSEDFSAVTFEMDKLRSDVMELQSELDWIDRANDDDLEATIPGTTN